MHLKITSLLCLTLPLSSLAAETTSQKDEHDIENMIVTASVLKRTALQSATPISVLSGEELDNNVAATLGDTLKNTPGVHSSYYGPVAASPIIRGLNGPRIKIVQNGLDSGDASRVGPDHAVSTEASTATQIEVLRGPATLLYGSGAIGGVVNVVDNRLPQVKQTDLSAEYIAVYDNVANQKNHSIDLNSGSGNVAWHFDAFDRQSSDYSIPHNPHAEDDADHHQEAADEHAAHQDSDNKIANSAIDASGFTFGIGWIGDDVTAAISFGKLDNLYGIPGHQHDDEHHEEEHEEEEHAAEEEAEKVFAHLKQDRYQALVDWTNIDGLFHSVHWHSGVNDYQHQEIEDQQIGTTFNNKAFESRLWAEHNALAGWQGVIGLHLNRSDFSAIGEEAFTPPTDTKNIALFILEEKKQHNLLWQLGARIEHISIAVDNQHYQQLQHEPHEEDDYADASNFTFAEQSYDALSASAGMVWNVASHQDIALNFAHSERAPSASELFSYGPHLGAGTFEIGAGFIIDKEQDEYHLEQRQQSLNKEVSQNIDLSYRHHADDWSLTANLFYNKINHYLFQRDTGLVIEDGHLHSADDHEDPVDEADEHEHGSDLPVYIFEQQHAKLMGFELEVDWHLNQFWRLDTFVDYTRATLDDGSYVPRIPPLRVGSELHFENHNWHAELGVSHYTKQSNIATYETATPAYTLVSASVNYYLNTDTVDLTFFVKGQNLMDEYATVHSSFIKDIAPLPGRGISIGIKAQI
ncbi:TonB-dependent receptor [Alteromonadaceae bacterium BrNp21-10]|nr:TonB-dependent receptor [Alteromonadaceae bacterium BrNp21-10]